MADQSIRGYLARLEEAGELIRFEKEVDPHDNLTAIGWKAYDRHGKASLFGNLKNFPGWQVANQIITDRRKWAVALGVAEDEVVATMAARIANLRPAIESGAGDAPVKEVVLSGSDADLTKIPAVWTSENDPGPYIAAGMAIIKDPDTGIRNMSIHRQQVMGPDRTGYLICPRQAQRIYQKYQARNQPMPVAMVVGAHPTLYFAAAFTASFGTDELAVAGGLLEDPIRLVSCETVDLEVPAEAEMVIEGEIPPDELVPEGPFGEGSGGYGAAGVTQLFKVKAITRRKDPIFYAMQCGAPLTDTQSLVTTSIDMLLWNHLANVEGGARSDRRALPRGRRHDGGRHQAQAADRGPGQDGSAGITVRPAAPPQARHRGRRGHRRQRPASGVLVDDHAGPRRTGCDQAFPTCAPGRWTMSPTSYRARTRCIVSARSG